MTITASGSNSPDSTRGPTPDTAETSDTDFDIKQVDIKQLKRSAPKYVNNDDFDEIDTDNEKRLQRLKFLVQKSKVYSSILSERLKASQVEQQAQARRQQVKAQKLERLEKGGQPSNGNDDGTNTNEGTPISVPTVRKSSRLASSHAETTIPATMGNKKRKTGNNDTSVGKAANKAKDIKGKPTPAKKQGSIMDFMMKKKDISQIIAVDQDTPRTQDILKSEANAARNRENKAKTLPASSPSTMPTTDDALKGSDEPLLNPTSMDLRQPRLITGGKLHPYQLAGLEWLISLYENGLNGILADEMGLGKTLQVISLLAFLVDMGIKGPFLIVSPLSIVQNWMNEINKFAPDIKALKYYGNPVEREALRTQYLDKLNGNANKKYGKSTAKDVEPENISVVVSSYDIVMNDSKFLQHYEWKYLIIDEGHRLKNMNCRLIKELKKFHTANRLLLTGTPLQNNLSELWSLLNFLLPDIFHDLELFQSWFDFDTSNNNSRDYDKELGGRENTIELVTSLHEILKPFLLRRVKTDVEQFLPDKREYVIYTTMTKEQTELSQSIMNHSVREFITQKIREIISANNQKLIKSGNNGGRALRSSSRQKNTDKIKKSNSVKDTSRRGRKKILYRESDDEEDDDLEDDDFIHRLETVIQDQDAEGNKELLLMEDDDERSEKIAKSQVKNKGLQNMVMQLRLCCNTPHLFYYPWSASYMSEEQYQNQLNNDEVYDPVDQRIINVSNKMRLLDTLVDKLLAQGRKLLIFSQFTRMLDILEDWAGEYKNVKYCRIDGNVSQTERAEQIDQFNHDPDSKIFLLSTRAGGLGINLTSADTVILFDSDWNPQQDLQAMDRVHRIGQTKPVLIFRLCVANSVEEVLLQKAGGKRRLEQLVIQRGKFKSLISNTSDDSFNLELMKLLQGDAANGKALVGTETLSENILDIILDRSDDAYARARNGEENLPAYIRTVIS